MCKNISSSIFSSIILFILILLIKVPIVQAATLYSNNLKTDFWNTFYSQCTTSNSGLTCTNPADAVNTTYFPTLACVSGNFTSNGGPNQLFILDQNTNFDSYVVLYIQSGHNLELNSNAGTIFDSSKASPTSGIHTYALCKTSNTYTSYLDGTLVQTQTFAGHIGGYIGFQTSNGEFLTNFIATNALPNVSNSTILYSNNFTSNFWNTFFGTCAPSNLGINCTATAVMNTTQLPTVKCVKVDADKSTGSPQLLLAEDPLLQNVIAVDFNNNSDILIKDINDNNFHSGVPVPSSAHNYGICQGTNQIEIYIDNLLVYTFNTIFPHLDYIGFTLYSGTTLTNYLATDTFINQFSDLPVPIFKQTSSPWGSQIYDGADKWSPGSATIGDWGCAMTSMAMILNYHGFHKLPDGTALDPGTLNTWLKNQPDGYLDGVSSGYMNPLAITRLSKSALGINNITTFDALEYQHLSGANKTQLTDDLSNSQPDMLEEPGHFIVGKGTNGNTFDINDPYYDRNDLANGYNNTFLSLNRYIPSHTDLSYIMLTVNPNVTVTVKTASGSAAIGDQFIQQPYGNPLHPNLLGGLPLKIVYVPKPATGNYKIILSGSTNQEYQLTTYLYDQQGNVSMHSYQGTVGSSTTDSFITNFNKQNASSSTNTHIVTFQSFIDDVNENVALQQINKNVGNALIPLINSAKDSEDKGQKIAAGLKLDAIGITLNIFHGKGITDNAFKLLLDDEKYLKNHL